MLTHGDYRLRPWTPDDAAALTAVTTGDEALHRWTGVRACTPQLAGLWIQAQIDGWADGTRYSYAILDRDDTLLGNVAVKLPAPEIGYWVAAAARGRGVATAGVEAATRWAFEELRLPALDLLHQTDNEASCRVAVKTGYTLRETLPPGGAYPLPGHRHTRRAAQ